MRKIADMRMKPSSLHHSLGEAFWLDAQDFLHRFDALWEHRPLMLKSGRIKSFVDLMMGCECALKAHIFLSRTDEDCSSVYQRIRKASHNIAQLVQLASFMEDRVLYEHLHEQLGRLGVSIRYSLDADGIFFPLIQDSPHTPSYSRLIGDELWVNDIRNGLQALIDAVQNEFTGQIDTSEALAALTELDEFVAENVLLRSRRRK